MANDVFGCWYEPGDSGTWLTWFINQHENYPKFDKEIRYEQEGNKFGEIASDYGCYGADWFITDFGNHKAIKFKDFKQSLLERKISYDPDYKHICYKLIPWHNPLGSDDDEIKEWGLTDNTVEDLIARLIEESNTKALIIPEVNTSYQLFAKRLAFIRPRFTVESTYSNYQNRQARLYANTISTLRQFTKVHTIAIDKLLLRNDIDEYLKLLDILQVPALEGWTSLTNDYYTKILQPWENISNSELNNRLETLKDNKENPY
tara:strand:- start:323 stop:1105 length:783 start_codon:yes stop_codon:yes gene_type:complete